VISPTHGIQARYVCWRTEYAVRIVNTNKRIFLETAITGDDDMITAQGFTKQLVRSTLSLGAVFLAGYAGCAFSEEVRVLLAGNQEIPQVTTRASGSGTFKVEEDKSVSGSVSTLSLAVTAAHIHEGAVSANGPVIIPLTKTAETVWSVPAGTKLTDAQYQSFKAGQLYVNVHTVVNIGGEIRGQLIPK
jgi:hypothetical protein